MTVAVSATIATNGGGGGGGGGASLSMCIRMDHPPIDGEADGQPTAYGR